MVEYTISHFQAILEILFVISILFILSKSKFEYNTNFFLSFIYTNFFDCITNKKFFKKIAEKRQYYEKKLLK